MNPITETEEPFDNNQAKKKKEKMGDFSNETCGSNYRVECEDVNVTTCKLIER